MITKTKQAESKKHYVKVFIEQFFNFSYKNIILDKIILFDAALFVQKGTMREGYAERVLNNYGPMNNK